MRSSVGVVTRRLVMALLLGLGSVTTSLAQTDPLPSWNDGAVKKSITDFVARTEDFQSLVRDVAMHIAAASPRFVRREEVTPELLERERAIYHEQAVTSGKPANVVDRIVAGKMEKFYGETVLLEQPFVKDPDKTITQLVAERVAKVGENIQIRRFARFKVGEEV